MADKNTCLKIHLAANSLWGRGSVGRALARGLRHLNQIALGCFIGDGAQIDPTVTFVHNGLGCVIHADTVIGADCRIFQQLTLGVSCGGGCSDGAPHIGKGVLIGAGAKVLGNVTVGDGARVGANAVVLKDVPPHATVVGIPARVVSVHDEGREHA